MAEVSLIASGYVWRCLECSGVEYESAVPLDRSVVCNQCGASFKAAQVYHRLDGGAANPAIATTELSPRAAPEDVRLPAWADLGNGLGDSEGLDRATKQLGFLP